MVTRIDHWPEGRGLLGLLIRDPTPLRLGPAKTDGTGTEVLWRVPCGEPADVTELPASAVSAR